MPDHRRGLPRNHLYSSPPQARNHLYSSPPDGQRNSHHDGSTLGFVFRDGRSSRNYGGSVDFGSSQIEFQTQLEDGYDIYSPPLWNMSMSKGIKNEASPLLPEDHHCSNLFPGSGLIAKGRRELMEMVQNMPESSYELSLKDIVDEQHVSQDDQQHAVSKEKSLKSDTKIQNKKQKRKKNIKRQIQRSESMERGIFLKMFYPTSLGSKKNSAVKNCSKFPWRSSSHEETDNHNDRESWKRRFLLVGDSKSNRSDQISGSTSSINSSGSRHADSSFLPACWPFFHTKKSKMERQKECLF